MEDIFEKLKAIVVDKLEVEPDQVVPGARFREDLQADSLDTYELLYAIDADFGISIPDEKASEFETVGDALEFIKANIKE